VKAEESFAQISFHIANSTLYLSFKSAAYGCA